MLPAGLQVGEKRPPRWGRAVEGGSLDGPAPSLPHVAQGLRDIHSQGGLSRGLTAAVVLAWWLAYEGSVALFGVVLLCLCVCVRASGA